MSQTSTNCSVTTRHGNRSKDLSKDPPAAHTDGINIQGEEELMAQTSTTTSPSHHSQAQQHPWFTHAKRSTSILEAPNSQLLADVAWLPGPLAFILWPLSFNYHIRTFCMSKNVLRQLWLVVSYLPFGPDTLRCWLFTDCQTLLINVWDLPAKKRLPITCSRPMPLACATWVLDLYVLNTWHRPGSTMTSVLLSSFL